MRHSNLFIATAMTGALLLSGQANALGPLGGLGGMGGGLGGGLGGSLGGALGGVNGTVNGAVNVDPNLSAVDQAAAQAHADDLRAQADARRAAAKARTVESQTTATTRIIHSDVSAVPALTGRVVNAGQTVVLPPVQGLAPSQVRIVRERQNAAFIAGGVAVLSEPEAYVYMDRQADDLRRDLAGTGVQVTRQGDDIVLEMPGDVTFAFNKSDIRQRFYPTLNAVAHTLNHYPATYVDVIGHTDAIGSVAYNQALSERRAESVAEFIEAKEDAPAPLYVAGRGKSEPIASNATIEGRAANRRVEILLHPYVRD